MNTIFLDFDGVLFDTLKEAYLLCRYSFSNVEVFEPIKQDEYTMFYKYKFLVYNSWQYYYLMKLLSQKTPESEFVNAYNDLLNTRDKIAEENFDKKYYEKRAKLKSENFEFWNKLEEPFEFFFEVKHLFEKSKYDIVIVSKKDFQSIKMRLNQYGLNLPDEKIFDKQKLEKHPEKSDFIMEYMNKNSVQRASFVDDNSNNLRPCEDIPNLKCLLAGWGNIAVDEVGLSCSDVINEIRIL